MRTRIDPATETQPPYLSTIYGRPQVMSNYHRHNDVEINFLERGSMTYLFPRGRRAVPTGSFTVFWAMFPHRVIAVDGDPFFYCLHIPLSRFLQWRLPSELVSEVLHGNIVVDRSPATARVDEAQFPIWHDEVSGGVSERLDTVFLEVQARLRRAGLSLGQTPTAPGHSSVRAETDKLGAMTAFIAEHYTDDLAPADVAEHVGLHPKYAMSVFRKAFDMTIVEYVTQLRISHAQRLLATTDMRIVELALEAGFGSISQFYDAFSRICGRTPTAFRVEMGR
jgi:AraC-like DNA-binding protein